MQALKISSLTTALLIALTAGSIATAHKAAGSKKVTISDRVGKNQFSWSSDAPLEKIKGTAEGVTGSLTLDPNDLSTIRGTISAQVSTMKTGNGTRDNHLKSAQWLDAGKHPTISFTITSVSGLKKSGTTTTGTATGTFTMHGVSKTMSIPFKLVYVPESDKTRERAPGDLVTISADFEVSLKDFNVAGTKGTVGSKVGEKIKVSAQLFGSTGL